MPGRESQAAGDPAVEQVLEYLNFSSGAQTFSSWQISIACSSARPLSRKSPRHGWRWDGS